MFPLEKVIEDQLRDQTGPLPTLILPEAGDPRMITAASGLIQFAKIVLVRQRRELIEDIDENQIPLRVSRKRFLQSVRCISPDSEPELCEEFAAEMVVKSKGRSWAVDLDEARELLLSPIQFSILAVRLGYADAVLGGVQHSSRDFFQPALRMLERNGTVYEMGVFALPDTMGEGIFRDNLVMFADVALNPEPSAERLADIAVGACKTMRNLLPVDVLPEVNGALLSYSTRGSGAGASVERIRGAEPLIRKKLEKLVAENPLYETINIATELQVSCAISMQKARSKLGDQVDLDPAVGNANVLIAPSLDTGNLLYHMYETGFPDSETVLIIGGMQNQALDFSRSSSAEDVEHGAKALILRTHRSGRFKITPKDRFFPRHRILTIGPHSGYTEVGVWCGREKVIHERIYHNKSICGLRPLEQIDDRMKDIRLFLKDNKIAVDGMDGVVARGGLLLPVESGTYRVDEKMLEDLRFERSGSHVVNLGALLAGELVGSDSEKLFVVDPAVVDEIDKTSRITGYKGMEQEAAWHALAQKFAAKHYAVLHGREYEDLNLIIAFIGAGTSIAAHKGGRCVKVRNALFDGPMSPDRAGTLPGLDLIDFCYSGLTREEVIDKLTRHGGLKSYLGTSSFVEIERRINNGDKYARLVVDAMIEQICQEIASLVPKFKGEQVDQIILTGAMVGSSALVSEIRSSLALLPIGITVYPGNLEAEALRDGGLRVLNEIEPLLDYCPLRSRF